MAPRAMVIGLDCAPPELVLGRWLDRLPTIRSLTEEGAFGVMRSCDPPITVPAWSVLASSRSPGALGVYGFRNRRDRSYAPLAFASSRSIRSPRVWDLLSARGRDVLVLGVPPTYPVTPVNGALVSCFLAPDTARPYTHPPALAQEIEAHVGEYALDVPGFRAGETTRFLADLEAMTEKRFRVAERLLATRPWDLFFMVEIGTDRANHRLWRSVDPLHGRHEPESPLADALLAYYRSLDEKIGRLLRFADGDTTVLVVSDHGAKRSDGGIRVNEWLRREGYLALKEEPAEQVPLTPGLVDWPRTTAWGEGGYYGRIFVNVRGREPEGTVAPGDLDRVRGELGARLEGLGDAEGRPLGTVAHRPEDLYAVVNGVPPDLLVYFGDLRWRSLGDVGPGAVHVGADALPDDAGHAHEGLYVIAGRGAASGGGAERRLVDVAPTLLGVLDEPVPAAMEGATL